MQQRKKIGISTLIIIGVLLGVLIKSVKIGLLIGLGLGFLITGLMGSRR